MTERTSRRDFLRAVAISAAAVALPTSARAQQGGNSMAAPMDEGGYRPVKRVPRGIAPLLTALERDALEHRLHCQCGTCTLDVYTCRTTDFNCPVSPAMHGDVKTLVAGGYSATEILEAFTGVYGEKVLMAPKRSGFNWAGYLMPFAAIATGAAVILVVLRRWRVARPESDVVAIPQSDATPDEQARLERAMRDDG